MAAVINLSLSELAQRCAEETEKFNRHQANDTQFCFELLRRALAEGQSDAFTLVYQTYERQTLAWVRSHSRFEQTGESAEYFARAALSSFYFALRGEKFARFPALPQVLAYLKLCVHSAIMQYLRAQRTPQLTSLDADDSHGHTPDLGARVGAAEIWERISGLLADARDRLLARCVLLQDLRPRQIVDAFPGRWRDEREISVAIYRIRRTLRNDPELRQWVEQTP